MPVSNPQPLYPQLRRRNLQIINACPTLDSLFIRLKLVRIAPSHQITLSVLHHFTPLIKLPPHSYTILPPWAAQLLAYFTPLWTKYPLTLTPF